jgi:Ca2+-binding RTX toxin-like protein
VARRRRDSKGRLGLFAGAAVAALLAFPAMASATVTSAVNNNVLTVTSTAGEAITITNDAATGQVKINGQNPNNGAAQSANLTAIQVTGDAGANNINLAAVTGTAFTALTSVNVDGAGGNDVINGSQLADVLKGGGANDRIIGDDNQPGTRDDMRGEAGNDTLVWNPGDDDDINEGGPGSDTAEVNGGGKEQFEVNPSATPGRVSFDRVQPNGDPTFGAPFNVDISDDTERLDLNAGGGDDIVNAGNGLQALAFALDIDGGDLNDVIDGGDGADLIDGAAGNDQIAADNNPLHTRDNVRGGPGNDTMTWNPGDGDDVNEGGDDNDTVVVNGGSVDEDFRVKPSSTPGRVSFDRTGPTPPGPFNIDIGTSENLVLNAGAGNDTIKGSKGLAGLIDSTFNGDDGNDRIKGTGGEDLLSGGKGSDLIRSIDRAADQVECDSGFDLALVDRRDTVRACEIVLGGRLKVKVNAKSVDVARGVATLKLKCVATKGCRGVVKLRYHGKTLAGAKFKMDRKKSDTVHLKLKKRGLRLLANAPEKGLKAKLRIDAKDAAGNGWRTDSGLRLKR